MTWIPSLLFLLPCLIYLTFFTCTSTSSIVPSLNGCGSICGKANPPFAPGGVKGKKRHKRTATQHSTKKKKSKFIFTSVASQGLYSFFWEGAEGADPGHPVGMKNFRHPVGMLFGILSFSSFPHTPTPTTPAAPGTPFPHTPPAPATPTPAAPATPSHHNPTPAPPVTPVPSTPPSPALHFPPAPSVPALAPYYPTYWLRRWSRESSSLVTHSSAVKHAHAPQPTWIVVELPVTVTDRTIEPK